MTQPAPADQATDTGVEQLDAQPVNAPQHREFYKARVKIHPKRAAGWFRSFKWLIMALTLGVYYVTPWLRWDRGPFSPDQAVLVDLANRRFYFFFIEIWPQEFFFVAGLLVMAGIGLFLLTSTLGRAWCGYACPQTVWVDLFLLTERFFEGDRNARIRLDKAPYNVRKLSLRTLKHASWLAISVATGGAWIFYFADAPTLAGDFIRGTAPEVAYITVFVLTATTYVFGGLMREQVCTYMCPWPRVQAAMLDEDSLIVSYNDWRGEPRGRHRKKQKATEAPTGDCVDCNACVAVCPMGIDIREGLQLECITCALCIDACDDIMGKLGQPKGLISYATLNDLQQNRERAAEHRQSNGSLAGFVPALTNWRSFVRPRTLLYCAVYALLGIGLLVALASRDRLDLNILHDRNPLFVQLSDGSIRNGYELKILNMVNRPRRFEVRVEGLANAGLKLSGSDAEQQTLVIDVAADELHSEQLFIRLDPADLGEAPMQFDIIINDLEGPETARETVRFEQPNRS